jgi:sporulation protein YlmC with PRC-barrel domain
MNAQVMQGDLIMIRNLLATTALAALVATAAYAQQDTTTQPAQPQTGTMPDNTATQAAPTNQDNARGTDQTAGTMMQGEGFLASKIIGENVYNGTGDNAEAIGDVNDMLVGPDGKVHALIIGVGGFLGIGERDVAVDFTQVSWAEGNNDRWLVYPSTKEQLESLPQFDRSVYDMMPSTDATSSVNGTQPAPNNTIEPAPMQPEPAQPAQ